MQPSSVNLVRSSQSWTEADSAAGFVLRYLAPMRRQLASALGSNAEADEAKPEGWKAALAGLWQEIRGLVGIRRQEKNLRPWLSDREEQLIYQGLQVRLDAARLAALRGKSTLFEQSVRSAQTWLLTWFDTQTAAVEAVDSELSALAKQHLAHNPPDISQSLSQLRQLRQQGLK